MGHSGWDVDGIQYAVVQECIVGSMILVLGFRRKIGDLLDITAGLLCYILDLFVLIIVLLN